MTRIRRVESEKELEKSVDDFLTRGYRIKKQTNQSAKVKENDWGEMPIHGFVFLFTFVVTAALFSMATLSPSGIWLVAIGANVIYATYSWFTSDEVLIKVDTCLD